MQTIWHSVPGSARHLGRGSVAFKPPAQLSRRRPEPASVRRRPGCRCRPAGRRLIDLHAIALPCGRGDGHAARAPASRQPGQQREARSRRHDRGSQDAQLGRVEQAALRHRGGCRCAHAVISPGPPSPSVRTSRKSETGCTSVHGACFEPQLRSSIRISCTWSEPPSPGGYHRPSAERDGRG